MDELERFKSEINLTEYAASQGYTVDRRETSRNSVIMRHADGDKIIIALGTDSHWIYFSVKNDSDNGSIIDFIQNRTSSNLGQVRQELRPWVGSDRNLYRPKIQDYVPTLQPVSKNITGVIANLGKMRLITIHPYLEQRGIPAALLSDNRLSGRIYIDQHQNAVFPHWNTAGFCGYEVKNKNFTGFSPGGEKGLWVSRGGEPDSCLVFAESAIDALSYAALFPDPTARYASIGGKMNPTQPELIKAAISRLPEKGEVIAATDADQDGHELAEQIKGIAQEEGKCFKAHTPQKDGADWNDMLRNKSPLTVTQNCSPSV